MCEIAWSRCTCASATPKVAMTCARSSGCNPKGLVTGLRVEPESGPPSVAAHRRGVRGSPRCSAGAAPRWLRALRQRHGRDLADARDRGPSAQPWSPGIGRGRWSSALHRGRRYPVQRSEPAHLGRAARYRDGRPARPRSPCPEREARRCAAVPDDRRDIVLRDRDGLVHFVERDTDVLDAELMTTDLGQCLVTTAEQTLLDLAHRPNLGHVVDEAHAAIVALLPRCNDETLERLADEQRLRAALTRARRAAP